MRRLKLYLGFPNACVLLPALAAAPSLMLQMHLKYISDTFKRDFASNDVCAVLGFPKLRDL